MKKLQDSLKQNHEETIKRLDRIISNLSKQVLLVTQEKGNYDVIELRSYTIPSASSKQKPIVEQRKDNVEEPNSTPIEDEVSDETLEKGETLDKAIDKDSPFRRTKNQIINEPNLPLLDYMKPSYSLNKKKPKREMEV